MRHRRRRAPTYPFLLSATDIDLDGVLVRCLVLTDLTTQKLVEKQLAAEVAQIERQRVAAEVNDTIVQGLVAAEMALDLGQVEYARSLVASTSEPRAELDRRARRRPGARARHGRPQRSPAQRRETHVTDGLSVLIVDDSEDLRELLSMVIERHPARVARGRDRGRGTSRRSRRPAPASPTSCCSTSRCR